MGTVELTGLAMTKMWALGQCLLSSRESMNRTTVRERERWSDLINRIHQEQVLDRSPKTYSAQAEAKSRTMEALVLKRSSRVMPGLRGTPAGMTTMSHPVRASLRPFSWGTWPVTYVVGMTTSDLKFHIMTNTSDRVRGLAPKPDRRSARLIHPPPRMLPLPFLTIYFSQPCH